MGNSTSQRNSREITLRKTLQSDLESFFRFQLDKEANYLAAFTAKDPADKEVYLAKYSKLVDDPTKNMQTILVDGVIVGSVSSFELDGHTEITYWIDKAFWGKGITTTALSMFLATESARPIFGRTAFDNFGSQKVLEKCGFVRTGNDRGFANARQAEIEEFIYQLQH